MLAMGVWVFRGVDCHGGRLRSNAELAGGGSFSSVVLGWARSVARPVAQRALALGLGLRPLLVGDRSGLPYGPRRPAYFNRKETGLCLF